MPDITMIDSFKRHMAGLAVAAGFALGALGLVTGPASAASEYPILKPLAHDWSFAGPFGTYDQQQLQRGLQVYRENCSNCHAMSLVAFRHLEQLGYSEDQVRSIAAEYTVTDGPNEEGEMFERAALPKDHFPSPYANRTEGAYLNNGAYPPDFSTLAKARAVERGFPTFLVDIVTGYAENGPDYIYSLLVGYQVTQEDLAAEIPAVAELKVADTAHFNPYFIAGPALAMPQPLYGDDVVYADGTPATIEQSAEDVAAFMMWAAEPTLPQRKQLGFVVLIFLAIFFVLMALVKKRVWRNEVH